jgi:hypothetical protein
MVSYILSSADLTDRKPRGFRAPKMRLCSILAVLLSGCLGPNNVQAVDKVNKVLLATNALGYTKDDRTVAYSDNYVMDDERQGECVNGPPPNTWKAPDAQTTDSDSACQALVSPSLLLSQLVPFLMTRCCFSHKSPYPSCKLGCLPYRLYQGRRVGCV